MKKLKLFIFLFVFIIIISFVLSAAFISFISNDFQIILNAESIFNDATLILTLTLSVTGTFLLVYIYFKQKLIGYKSSIERTDKADSTVYGDSEWLTDKQINNLFKCENIKNLSDNAQGIIVGSKIKDGNLYVNYVYGRHSLVVGTSGTGKNKYFLEPTIQFLANSPVKPSLLIPDPKGENFADNSALLASKGYDIKVFNLNEPKKSHKYNPLSLIWKTYRKYSESQDSFFLDETDSLITELAIQLCPINDDKGDWQLGGQNIIQGIIWAMLEDSMDKRFTMTEDKFLVWQIQNILSQGNDVVKDFLLRRPKTSMSILKARKFFDSKAEETSDSYLSGAMNKLSSFVGFGMNELMKTSDIDISKVQDRPTAIFVIVPDENTSRHPLATLFISQVYKQLTALTRENEKTIGKQELTRDFYFLLDEFGNFPKMPCIEQMLSIGRSRKLWTMISVQSIAQLNKIYGKETTSILMNNLHLVIYLGATDPDVLKYFSEFFGNRTIRKNNINLGSADLTKELQGSTQLEKAALITPEELSKRKQGEPVFKVFQQNPAKTNLIPIFNRDLQNRGVFKLGKADISFETPGEKPFSSEGAFYDLIDRDNRFDNIVSSLPTDEELNIKPIDTKEEDEIIRPKVSNNVEELDLLKIIKGFI